MVDKFISLCYHYIRTPETANNFPRILGNSIKDFEEHIIELKNKFKIISENNLKEFYLFKGKAIGNNKKGVLITFDDGLSDHYDAAKVLSKHGINGIFFIPTCILMDNKPANPNIIHYVIALYKINGFLKYYLNALEELKLFTDDNLITFEKGLDDPFAKIREIKNYFKYKFSYEDGRKILLEIYKNSLLNYNPEFLSIIHLTKSKIKEMISMGHSIGVHTHSHISVASTQLNENIFKYEIVNPKYYIENEFNFEVSSFSYPYGHKEDYLETEKFIERTNDYNYAFTVETIYNTKYSSKFEIGRYQPKSGETKEELIKNLSIIS